MKASKPYQIHDLYFATITNLLKNHSDDFPRKLTRLVPGASWFRRAVLPSLLLLALTWSAAEPAYGNDPVITVSGNTVTVRIDQPVVTQRETDYPTVRFLPGDTVEVGAGGCVQTGGSGKTWKRYVNPSGDNSDRLYHGRIQIPTATAGLETIQGVMGRSPVVVLKAPAGTDLSQYFLRLGYDDDEYDDNGYYSHDDGTENQCSNVGNAFVELRITHQAQNTPPPPPRAPMDLWWSSVDDNLLPLNPFWGAQVNADDTPNGRVPDSGQLCNNFHDENDNLQLGNPPCTTQRPTVDEPNGWDDPTFWAVCQTSGGVAGAVHGHINWGLATYTGQLFFTDHSVPVPSGTGDDDYDMSLQRSDQASATTGNELSSGQSAHRSLGLEFDSDETIDHFDTPWWSSFHSAVDSDSSWAAARGMIDNANAIVTGVIGIDNKHGSHAELHPVLGLMARVPNRSNPSSDFWVFFARTQGDEGGCSQDLHQFASATSMEFLLPLNAAQKPAITASNVRTNLDGGSWSATSLPDGLLITINFPPAAGTAQGIFTPMVWGELTISHTSLLNLPFTATKTLQANNIKKTEPAQGTTNKREVIALRPNLSRITEEDQDDYLGPIKAKLTAAEWQKFQDAYLHPTAPLPTVAHAFFVSRASFEKSPTSFARFSAIGVEGSVLHSSIPLKRIPNPGVSRHRTLNKAEPRNLSLSPRVANRGELLQHQLITNALQTAIGPIRTQQLLQSPTGLRPIPENDKWMMPAFMPPKK